MNLRAIRLAWVIALIGLAVAPIVAATNGETKVIQLASVHAVIGDIETGEILYTKRDAIPVPIASLTKLMTAVVVLDGGQSLDESIPVVKFSGPTEKNCFSRLRVGSSSPRGQLLRVALMSSDNLAAWTLAQHYTGGLEAFTAAMNAKAEALGMTNTHYDDPTGLSLENRSSASDLWKLLRAAYGYETIRAYSTTTSYTAKLHQPNYTLGYWNTNPLISSGRWQIGLSKTGYLDEAGRCLLMVADIDGRKVGIVLLNSFGTRTPQGDASRVRRWLESESVTPVAGAAADYERRVAKVYDAAVAASKPGAQAH
jgi:serine-type D-Ala-D-Ala endopeptidase (penicillin-binding protein 7)